ncbi:MAG: hypothetical protein OXI22_05055 [Defluviicoccus sp.]|nr:hypothetical protein [Defluviicoccus sp.]MDE0383232.1 hypothetical protein [Defluviicoccus sp.]
MTADLLTVPLHAGRAIVETGAVFACPLLGTDRFVRFCSDCNLAISRERLIRLERLGLFAPVFRVKTPRKATRQFRIPPAGSTNWFSKRWARDTTAVPQVHAVPTHTDRTQEGYYSIFQIYHLDSVLSAVTLELQLDSFLDLDPDEPVDWLAAGTRWLSRTRDLAASLRDHQYRPAVALLCQHISNRYYPQTQSDMRTQQVRKGSSSDQWVVINAREWDWDDESQHWDPGKTKRLYRLTPEKLRHAYEGLATAQAHCDPIRHWYPLTQFVSVRERRKLKNDALRAESLRAGAHMLRLLHIDLYGRDLPHPNEVTGTVVNHVPELEARRDVRRHLEFVANRFGVNPQPRLSLIVEGQSEETAVKQIFEDYFGSHPGVLGIEIVVLGGVDVATGGKREDRFRAIMRLIDYLHHHQTFAFLILDNENYAHRLKNAGKKMKSIHTNRRYVTRPEYIRIWKRSFEFDNFSCTEIAAALGEVAEGRARFTAKQVRAAREEEQPGAALATLYRLKTNCGLPKIGLSEALVRRMLCPAARRNIENRPIVGVLDRLAVLAARNHLPTTQRTRDANQESRYLGLKRRPRATRPRRSVN